MKVESNPWPHDLWGDVLVQMSGFSYPLFSQCKKIWTWKYPYLQGSKSIPKIFSTGNVRKPLLVDALCTKFSSPLLCHGETVLKKVKCHLVPAGKHLQAQSNIFLPGELQSPRGGNIIQWEIQHKPLTEVTKQLLFYNLEIY